MIPLMILYRIEHSTRTKTTVSQFQFDIEMYTLYRKLYTFDAGLQTDAVLQAEPLKPRNKDSECLNLRF